jgi:hypothetical protein
VLAGVSIVESPNGEEFQPPLDLEQAVAGRRFERRVECRPDEDENQRGGRRTHPQGIHRWRGGIAGVAGCQRATRSVIKIDLPRVRLYLPPLVGHADRTRPS